MKTQQTNDYRTSLSIVDSIEAAAAGKSFQENKWGARHHAKWTRAMMFPNISDGKDAPGSLVRMIHAWAAYADAHRKRYEASVTGCGMMGPAWEAIGRQLRIMLNGELGELDAGTLDQMIGDVQANEGADIE